jgi:hypothetical protein
VEHETPGIEIHNGLNEPIKVLPHVQIRVSFDLHDHENALMELAAGYDAVKAQIEETRG